MSKVLLTGGTGLLGTELQKLGHDIIAPSHKECNIMWPHLLGLLIEAHKPDIIIHAAAVKDNRLIEKEPRQGIRTNIIGTANIALMCLEYNIRMVYISTDYIYQGDRGNYKETDPVKPFNLYAWTKLGGECSVVAVPNHLIIRTSFGANEFPYTEAFTDKWTSKDYVNIIAPMILEAALSPLTGVLNIGTDRKTLYQHAGNAKAIKISETNFNTPYDTSLNIQKWLDYKSSTPIAKTHCKCRICGSTKLTKYLDLGLMPLANNLEFTSSAAKNTDRYPLQILFCEDCALSQLSVVINPEKMFSYYTYRSSVNQGYIDHCEKMARSLKSGYDLNKDSLHIDIACFPENNFINTKRGSLKISAIKLGDYVLSHDGEYHKVINLFNRQVETVFTKLKLKGLNTNTEMTGNHPVLTSSGWKQASDLKCGDFIQTKSDFNIGDDLPIDLYDHISKCHPFEIKIQGDYIISTSNGLKTKLPRYIKKTKEFATVLGYYVGNGSGGGGSCVNIVFNKKYTEKLWDIKKYFLDTFDIHANEILDENVITVRFNSRLLSSFFKSICGHKAKNKKIPFEVLSQKTLPDFLSSFWFTDGHISNYSGKTKFIYSTSSKNLIIDLWNILESYGIISAVQCVKNNRGFSKEDGILYRLTVERNESISKLSNFFNGILPEKIVSERFIKILSIEREQRECEVFNFEVETSNTYVCNGLVVHNCNDGALLVEFKDEIGLNVLGVDPASNLTAIAESNGIQSVTEFWGLEVAKMLPKSDLITATNVFAHLDNVTEFIQAAKLSLNPRGILVIENPYIVDFIETLDFGQTYFEHVSFISLWPLMQLCTSLDMKVIDVSKHAIHGGTMRYIIAHAESGYDVSNAVHEQLQTEEKGGYHSPAKYLAWSDAVKKCIKDFGSGLLELKKSGHRIAGFAASAKGNTLLNCAGINTDIMDYIADQTPEKIQKFCPGTGIPIYAIDKIMKTKPDYIVVLSWNFGEEIMNKVRGLGFEGKFIVPVPEFRII